MTATDRLDTVGIWTEHRPPIPVRLYQPAIGPRTGICATAVIQEPGITRIRWHRSAARA